MVKLSIACLVSGSKLKWEELAAQKWQDEQLIIGVTNPVADLGGVQNWSNCVVVSGSSEDIENLILEEVTGDYLLWFNPQESIQKNFILDIRNWLENIQPNADKILYGFGFVYRNGKTIFSPEALPALSKPLAVENILDNFGYFLPCVKYLWRTDLIKEWNLKYNSDVESWVLKQALFSLDYISSLYKVNGYTTLKSVNIPFSYITGFDPATPFLNNEYLLEKIQDKKEIWLANPLSKVAWKYRQMQLKAKIKEWKQAKS